MVLLQSKVSYWFKEVTSTYTHLELQMLSRSVCYNNVTSNSVFKSSRQFIVLFPCNAMLLMDVMITVLVFRCISVFNILFNLVGIFTTINTITKKQLTKGSIHLFHIMIKLFPVWLRNRLISAELDNAILKNHVQHRITDNFTQKFE